MTLQMHPAYAELVAKAARSHEKNRSPEGITAADVGRARLYCYAFRLQTIGAFHATRLALRDRPAAGALAMAHRTRAVEALEDLVSQAMEPVPRDFRAVIATLYRYHRNIERAVDGMRRDHADARDEQVGRVADRFRQVIEQVTAGNGIHLTRDLEPPAQASFIVPNLGITIVPLVYGDHHSWNLAHLGGQARDVPTHRHHHGVEIHLGFNPTHGMTVLGRHRAAVEEGYAMPIPPETDHGWVNTATDIHHVPFIFGSLKHGGWGVFLDVEAQPKPVDELTTLVPRDSAPFSQMVYLERQIARAEAAASTWRTTLIPASVTSRGGSGGLELNLTRVNPAGFTYPADEFRIISVVRGAGLVTIDGIEQAVTAHDHWGVPAGMTARLKQTGSAPMVALDALIRGAGRLPPGG